MKWSEIGGTPCSVARALSVVGDRWVMLVLREAFLGVRRFEDFHARINMSRRVLAERLAALVDEGILERRAYSDRPERFEYRLTAKGRDLYPVITALLTWGDRWMADPEGPAVELVHNPCGTAIHPVQACPQCGGELHPRDMTPVVKRDLGAA
ncbi:DNA-binding HxlR family transcriptional regulator [Lipingzhangella halophila]|uniref:DNA-binding HxlR family transcriptional regulator n=1 Tax=Lipingzhangella halophila TaxID=1783352 RepID=A0A7W7W536_9ACTN|nr:helix-turn-helix domain-containing protein [Lipingzhangella halophila]MBB4933360.1 DNA-binding HxlR family transcriptional regulator [Lipingzhangella halophila]